MPPFFVPFLAPPAGKNVLPFFRFAVSFLQLFFFWIFVSDHIFAISFGTSDHFLKIHKLKFNSTRRKGLRVGPQNWTKKCAFLPKIGDDWGSPWGAIGDRLGGSSLPQPAPEGSCRSADAGVPCEALRRARGLQDFRPRDML